MRSGTVVVGDGQIRSPIPPLPQLLYSEDKGRLGRFHVLENAFHRCLEPHSIPQGKLCIYRDDMTQSS